MTGEQGEVGLLRHGALVAAYQRQNFVVASQIVIVVAQVNGGITVARKLHDCLLAQPGGFSIAAFQEKVALGLPCALGRGGVRAQRVAPLTDEETFSLGLSAATLMTGYESVLGEGVLAATG